MMKIIAHDNFDRENVDDIVVAENVPAYWANQIVDALNRGVAANSARFLKAHPDDYKPYEFKP